ncbi:MAG: hybrid sensor histidine kinase/response regulator [Parvularculaceae bacterium]
MAAKSRVLIVDDDPIMRELASAKLGAAGYVTHEAENGEEALKWLQGTVEGAVDLIITDVDMPQMSGFDLTRAVRSDEKTAETPVLVITGSEHPQAVEEAFSAGATSFLAKPINWTLFTQAVRFVLKASADQQELRSARDAAEAGARFKDSLLSVMSHELRTPLNAIIGFGQILSDQFERENDHQHKEYADYVVDGGKRLLNSVSDMLLASDARTGPIALNDIDCTLEDIIELALSPYEKALSLAQADVKKMLKDQASEICCDRALIARAVGKLVDNAMKFAPRGVQIVIGSAVMKNGEVAIMVRDNGPGMPADRLKAAMTPFNQADMSLRRSKEGLGLGLPLVNAIVSAHGGRFKIESEEGRGASAFIILPRKRVMRAGKASAA